MEDGNDDEYEDGEDLDEDMDGAIDGDFVNSNGAFSNASRRNN